MDTNFFNNVLFLNSTLYQILIESAFRLNQYYLQYLNISFINCSCRTNDAVLLAKDMNSYRSTYTKLWICDLYSNDLTLNKRSVSFFECKSSITWFVPNVRQETFYFRASYLQLELESSMSFNAPLLWPTLFQTNFVR